MWEKFKELKIGLKILIVIIAIIVITAFTIFTELL